jgi:tight adherence protein B
MRNRYLAQREIEVMVAGKKMEQQVMNLIPLGIILFLQISSGDYMDILYHNPLGVCCMTICLGVYCFAMWMAEKIMEIEV